MKKSYFIFPFLFLSLLSCSRGILGDAEDTIGLERREVLFASGKDSIELRTTKGDDWWLSSISTSDTTYINHSVKDIIMEGGGSMSRKLAESPYLLGWNPIKQVWKEDSV